MVKIEMARFSEFKAEKNFPFWVDQADYRMVKIVNQNMIAQSQNKDDSETMDKKVEMAIESSTDDLEDEN